MSDTKQPIDDEQNAAIGDEMRRLMQTVPKERMGRAFPTGRPRIIPMRKGQELEPDLQEIQNRLDKLWEQWR